MRFVIMCLLFAAASAQSASYPRLAFDPMAGRNTGNVHLAAELRALSLVSGESVLVGTAQQPAPGSSGPVSATHSLAHLVHLDASGNAVNIQCCISGGVYQSYEVFGGTGNTIPHDAALDPRGNVWIVGTTDSDDFPLVGALVTQKAAYQITGFVAEIDPVAGKLLFSSYFGGTKDPAGGSGTAELNALGFDAQGNVYVAGDSNQSDFPATLPVLGTPGPVTPIGPDTYDVTYGFVAKLAAPSNASPALVWSVPLGGNKPACRSAVATSVCDANSAFTDPLALAVDALGNVTLSGTTDDVDYPISAGAFQGACNCDYGIETGFVSRIAADGKSLLWSTYVGTNSLSLLADVADACGTVPSSISQDSAGNVLVAGTTCGPFPVSAGALQTSRSKTIQEHGAPDGFAAKLSPDGATLLAATYLGGQSGSQIAGLALDGSGNLWVGGTTASPDFPSLAGMPAFGNDFLVELSSDFSTAQRLYRMPTGAISAPPAFDSSSNAVVLSATGVALRLDPSSAFSGNAIFAISNAAVLTSQAGLGPAQLSTILGVGLGPAAGAAGAPDAGGAFPTQLAGVQVLIDGAPAPLLYASANQINFQATNFLLLGQPATLEVVTPAGTLGPYPLNYVPTVGVLRNPATGGAAALNQDYSVNSPSNPAAPGSILMLYATVSSAVPGYLPVGAVASTAASIQDTSAALLVTAFGPIPQIVFYAGTAPGLINGVVQINVQLPTNLAGPYNLTVSAPELGVSDTVEVFSAVN